MADGVYCLVGSCIGTIIAMMWFLAQLEETYYEDDDDEDMD